MYIGPIRGDNRGVPLLERRLLHHEERAEQQPEPESEQSEQPEPEQQSESEQPESEPEQALIRKGGRPPGRYPAGRPGFFGAAGVPTAPASACRPSPASPWTLGPGGIACGHRAPSGGLGAIGRQQAAPGIYRRTACCYQRLSMRVECHSQWWYTWRVPSREI